MGQKLREILKNGSSDYYGRLDLLEKEAEDILPEIRLVFPKYTNHDIAHKKGVEAIIDYMLPLSIKTNLNNAEIFYLIVATWFHDVGMKLKDENEEKKFGELEEKKLEEFKEEIRKQHHIRSSNYIIENASDLNLSTEEAQSIADICRSHRQINIQKEIEDPIQQGKRVRLRFLGAILRVADECHVTEDRVSRLFLKTIDHTSYEFSEHYRKHQLISGILCNESNDKKIRISARVSSEDDEEILTKIRDKIQEELDGTKTIFADNNLFLENVELELNKNELIKKFIILNLLDGNLKDLETISSEIYEDSAKVKRNINDLNAKRTLWQNESQHYGLNEDINTFEELVTRFVVDRNNYDFINSEYAQKIISQKLLTHLGYLYNVFYTDPDEMEDRIEILKKSPTAIYLSLFGKELFKNPNLGISSFQGDICLDLILLLGLSYDIFKYPLSNLKFNDIFEFISNKAKDRFPDLMELYTEARKYK